MNIRMPEKILVGTFTIEIKNLFKEFGFNVEILRSLLA